MIEQIKNIGHEVRIIDGEKDLVELWTKDTKPMDNVIFINIDEGERKVTKELRSFYKDVYKDAEGVATMQNIAKNMSWLLKSIEAGKKAGLERPELSTGHTNFHH